MSTLYDRIVVDLDAHRRAREDKVAIGLLNTLKGEAAKMGKDKGNRLPTDAETVSVIRTFIGGIEQSIESLTKVGRETADQERELAILKTYLPAELTEEELLAVVRKVIADNPDKVEQVRAKPGMAGWFVGQVKKETGGLANVDVVTRLVKEVIGL